MFLPAHAVTALADYLAEYLDGEEKAYAEWDEDADWECMDPNDFIIFKQFVLPDLQDARETGIDTEDLLAKGWMLTAGMIPALLYQDNLPPATYGALARAMQTWFLEEAIHYIGYIKDEWYRENVERVNQYIRYALLSEKVT
jgi:hypothetical protein